MKERCLPPSQSSSSPTSQESISHLVWWKRFCIENKASMLYSISYPENFYVQCRKHQLTRMYEDFRYQPISLHLPAYRSGLGEIQDLFLMCFISFGFQIYEGFKNPVQYMHLHTFLRFVSLFLVGVRFTKGKQLFNFH